MRHFLVIFKTFLILGLILTLFSCDNNRNTKGICKKNPEICADLHGDSWCRFERGHLIRHRLELKNTETPSDKQVYDQLIFLEDYSNCIELAAGVEHIINTDRTFDRQRAFVISTQNLAQLQEHTKDNPSPLLSYYHWSRSNDQDALLRLLAAEKLDLLTDPEVIGYLAGYYLTRDIKKSQAMYIKAIAFSNEDNFKYDWLLGLSEAYERQKDFERSYLAAKAGVILGKNHVMPEKMRELLGNNQKVIDYLDERADELADEIDDEDFADSKIRLYLAKPVTQKDAKK